MIHNLFKSSHHALGCITAAFFFYFFYFFPLLEESSSNSKKFGLFSTFPMARNSISASFPKLSLSTVKKNNEFSIIKMIVSPPSATSCTYGFCLLGLSLLQLLVLPHIFFVTCGRQPSPAFCIFSACGWPFKRRQKN